METSTDDQRVAHAANGDNDDYGAVQTAREKTEGELPKACYRPSNQHVVLFPLRL